MRLVERDIKILAEARAREMLPKWLANLSLACFGLCCIGMIAVVQQQFLAGAGAASAGVFAAVVLQMVAWVKSKKLTRRMVEDYQKTHDLPPWPGVK